MKINIGNNDLKTAIFIRYLSCKNSMFAVIVRRCPKVIGEKNRYLFDTEDTFYLFYL